MESTGLLTRVFHIAQRRGLLRPPKNLPIRGIYRTDGETVRKGDLLVSQPTFNYHPGLNVVYENDRGEKLLKSTCDGVVRITTENVKPDINVPEMAIYEQKKGLDIRKLTFNVVPSPMSNRFNLSAEV